MRRLVNLFWLPSLIVSLGLLCSGFGLWRTPQSIASDVNTYGLLILTFCLLATHGSRFRPVRLVFGLLGMLLCALRVWWFIQEGRDAEFFSTAKSYFLVTDFLALPLNYSFGGIVFLFFHLVEEVFWPCQIKTNRVSTSFSSLFIFSFASIGVLRIFFNENEGLYIYSMTRFSPLDAFAIQVLAAFYLFQGWSGYHRQFSLYRTCLAISLVGGCAISLLTSGMEKQIYTVTINQMEKRIHEIRQSLNDESQKRLSTISIFTDYLLTVPSPTEEKLNSMIAKLNAPHDGTAPAIYFFDRNLELKWTYRNGHFSWGRDAQTELAGRKFVFVDHISQALEGQRFLFQKTPQGPSVSISSRLSKNGKLQGYLIFEEHLIPQIRAFFKNNAFGAFLMSLSTAQGDEIIQPRGTLNYLVKSEANLQYLGFPLKLTLRPGRNVAFNNVMIPQLSIVIVGVLIVGALIYTIYVNRKRVEDVEQEVQDRIREMKALKEEADQAKMIAEHASYAKSQFLANMSHEIRTPLNVLLGASELLSETELTEEQKNYVRMFQTSGRHLLGLLNDIIDLSRIESGQLETERINFDLNRTLEFVRNLFFLKAQEHAVNFEVEKAEVPLTVRVGDPLRIRQILVNLIGNAFKFTKQGSIRLTVSEPYPNQIRFVVEDTGVGIPAEKQKEIFETFQQGDASFSRKHGGAGLGLAISKNLCKLMGGSIELLSEVGKGSRFIVDIPLPAATLTSAPILKSSKPHDNDQFSGIPHTSLPGFELSSKSFANQPRKRILLVDDSDDNRFLVKLFLEKLPYVIVEAHNGEEAVRIAKSESFDLIIMDMQMPVLDGYEAVKQIREIESQRPFRKPTPILALTAHGTNTERSKCLQIGCSDYLSKPVSKGVLKTRISELTNEFSLEA